VEDRSRAGTWHLVVRRKLAAGQVRPLSARKSHAARNRLWSTCCRKRYAQTSLAVIDILEVFQRSMTCVAVRDGTHSARIDVRGPQSWSLFESRASWTAYGCKRRDNHREKSRSLVSPPAKAEQRKSISFATGPPVRSTKDLSNRLRTYRAFVLDFSLRLRVERRRVVVARSFP